MAGAVTLIIIALPLRLTLMGSPTFINFVGWLASFSHTWQLSARASKNSRSYPGADRADV